MRGENNKKPKKWGTYDAEEEDFTFARELGPAKKFQRCVEAELMDWADDVTYSVHDIEDFYRAGRIPMHLLARLRDNRERVRFFDDVYERHKNDKDFFRRDDLEEAFADVLAAHWRIDEPYSGTKDHRSRLRDFTAKLIGRYINGVELSSSKNPTSIRSEFVKEVAILKELTWTYVIDAPALSTQQEGQRTVIRRLVEVYADAADSPKRWALFPTFYRERLTDSRTKAERLRTVIDLIAGMTEPQAIATYRQLIGVSSIWSLEEIVR